MIAPKLKDGWKNDPQRRQFETWWRPENTMMAMIGDRQIGWIAFQEKGDQIDIEHGCLLPEFQQQGLGAQVLQQLLDGWKRKAKSIELSVLKDSPHRKFFEDFGFQQFGEDQLSLRMRRKHN
jgi:N-acetylglutamate synthase-like GNAT family acetyltransferase